MEKEFIPKETETIAARRARRLADKFKRKSGRIGVDRVWWSNVFSEVGILFFIFLLNFYLVIPFFSIPAPDNSFSGPVAPLLIKIVEVSGVPIPYAIQFVTIFFFLIFPLSFYIFVKYITERKMTAFIAALFISLPMYPFLRLRVNASLLGYDAAHVASVAFIPIALTGLFSFIRKGGAINLVIASVSAGIVALISPFGFMTYLIFAAISTFSEMLLGQGRLKLIRLLAVLLFAGGLNSFWYNPGFFGWMITGPMGEEVRATIAKLVPISFFVVPALGAFGYLLFDRKPNLQPLFLASFYTVTFMVIAIAGGGVFPSHPSRYAYEFGMSLAFLISVVIIKLIDLVRLNKKIKVPYVEKRLANIVTVLLVVALTGVIIVGRNTMTQSDVRVLGIWEGVEKGEIWTEKDKFKGFSSYFGYTLTGISVIGLTFVTVKTKKEYSLHEGK